ncbi:MAG: hypothetical protein K2X97_12630 [Mycobacteriaceae bacterium]|nr:hypothetical protein [Mycobacteriaceae bacterium]
MEIVLRREQPEQRQFVYLRLTPDRTLVYTAGRKAMRNENPQERPTWRGTVPPEVYQDLVSMARAARAAEGVEAAASMPTYRLVVINEGELFPGELVGGPSPALDELYRRLVRVQTDARAEELDPARLPR